MPGGKAEAPLVVFRSGQLHGDVVCIAEGAAGTASKNAREVGKGRTCRECGLYLGDHEKPIKCLKRGKQTCFCIFTSHCASHTPRLNFRNGWLLDLKCKSSGMELGDDSALVKALLPSVFFLTRGYGGKVPGSFRNTYRLENSESAGIEQLILVLSFRPTSPWG